MTATHSEVVKFAWSSEILPNRIVRGSTSLSRKLGIGTQVSEAPSRLSHDTKVLIRKDFSSQSHSLRLLNSCGLQPESNLTTDVTEAGPGLRSLHGFQCFGMPQGYSSPRQRITTSFHLFDSFPYRFDSHAGILKVHRITLDANETFASEQSCNVRGAVSKKRVDDVLCLHLVSKVPHLLQRSRAGQGATSHGLLPRLHGAHMPISRKMVTKPTSLGPVDNWVPRETTLRLQRFWVDLARCDDAPPFGKVCVPAICFELALPHKARAICCDASELRHECLHQCVVALGCVVIRTILVANAIRRITDRRFHAAGSKRGHDLHAVALIQGCIPDGDWTKTHKPGRSRGVGFEN
jgi:hypothetical protein